MLTLLKKELRAQLPFVAFIVFLVSMTHVTEYFTRTLARSSLRILFEERMGDDSLVAIAIMYAALAMAITFGLFSREFDDRTINFLDGLPISRLQLYLAKWFAAATALAVFPLLDAAFVISIRWFGTNSLDRSLHLDWILTGGVLQLVQLLSFLSIGIVLSFFRRVGWLILGI